MQEPPITDPDQNDDAARQKKPVTDSRGEVSPYPQTYDPTAPSRSNTDDPSFDELLRRKNQLGIYSPIRLIPGFRELIAVPFQKILIVRIDKINPSDLLTENNDTTLQFVPFRSNNQTPKPLMVRVVRVCEYENPDSEYSENGKSIPTNTVLIEWEDTNEPFITFINGQKGIVEDGQIENLIIQGRINNQPGKPIEDIPLPDGFSVVDSDFNTHQPEGIPSPLTDPVVAVLDTGIKTQFRYDDKTITHQYPDSSQPSQMKSFKLALAPEDVPHQHGYSPVTNYLRASKDSDPVADQAYRTIPTLTQLHKLLKAQILDSPYDDHLLTKGQDPNKEVSGRHGTTISAIINQKSTAAVLPVKIFNHGGQGTLYDLLCGLNYVLACRRNGLPVRVVNLSLAGQLHYGAYQLLRSKFRALHKAGIWSVAAAGNRQDIADENSRRKLKANVTDPKFDPSANPNTQEVWNLFPACFAGDPKLSVLTVTTVQESSDGDVPMQPKKPKSIWSLIIELLLAIFGLLRSPKKPKVTPDYKTVNNYGKSFVSVGVIEPLTKVFKNANSGLNTTSFAAAFFSAKLADYLNQHATADRQQILDDLTFRGEMVSDNEIADNRLIHY